MEKNILLGVGITNATAKDILQYILTGLEKKSDPYYITTPNPEILMYANKHSEFRSILNNARLALPDGIGVIIAGKVMGKPFVERVTGADFMELLCQGVAVVNSQHREKPITVGFLGGRGEVAEKTAECLIKRYPGLKVVFVGEEWTEKSIFLDARLANENFLVANPKKQTQKTPSVSPANSHSENFVGSQRLSAKQIDILFVAYGFPKQEEFMAKHIGKIPVKIMMGVGGSFDYLSGSVRRAPLLIRSIGFEWLYRLMIQPWRIKRQFALLEFCLLVLQEKLRNNKKHE